jgi:hypothetical protein
MGRMSRRWAIGLGALVGVVAIAAALVLYRRVETGKWQPPEVLAEAVHDVLTSTYDDSPRVPKVIWLARDGVTLRGGADDSLARLSSVVALAKNHPAQVSVPKFKGGDKLWKQLVTCVQAQYSRFDVVVTDVEPHEPGYVLVAVGGKPAIVGASARTGGLAPFAAGIVIEDPVVFVFSDALGNRLQPMCETAAMEIAHTYGLDHEYLCPDPMSYLGSCGKKTFQDQEARCGETKARDCGGGRTTQNSVRMLREALGASKAAEVTAPARPAAPAAPAPAKPRVTTKT